jgi:hypothetical protein
MSGPIIRKYGFPNHESIFGKKDVEHGLDEGVGETEEPAKSSKPKKATTKPSAKKKIKE